MDVTPIIDEPVRGGYPPVGLLALPGPERQRIFASGVMPRPPISHLFGMRPSHLTPEGESVFTMPASEWLQTSVGVFFGATAVLVADAPFGSCLVRTMAPGVYGTTSEISMSFLRPASPASETLTARARVIDSGRKLGLAEATVSDSRGRILAHGTSRYVFLRIDPLPEPPGELEPYEEPVYDTPDPYLRPVQGEVLPPDLWRERSGLDILRAAVAGDLPPSPVSIMFGSRLTHVEEGRSTMTIPASKWFTSPARTIYGGMTAFIADMAITSAINTTMAANSAGALVDLKVNYLRPGVPDGRLLTAHSEVVHRGRQMAVARTEIVNEDDKVIAIATGSALILEGRVWEAERPLIAADEADAEESDV